MTIAQQTQIEQSIDPARPHTLLTGDIRRSGSLVYRYDDTGETVSVPNIWYNQPFDARVSVVRWDAEKQAEHAAQIKKYPPFGLSPSAVADLARRYLERAARIRAEAARMEAAGECSRPVAASRIPLNYGDNVR